MHRLHAGIRRIYDGQPVVPEDTILPLRLECSMRIGAPMTDGFQRLINKARVTLPGHDSNQSTHCGLPPNRLIEFAEQFVVTGSALSLHIDIRH
ncbi:hypothetical protein ASE00_15375 [Sphingomonas sp. Root710]|nr:hypothetical protein ASE00_15375 [Sphingomonas sp. Root710]